jgi:hypothetical protein
VKYATHVIVLNEGRVVLNGKPKEILGSKEARLIGVGVPKATRLFQLLEENGLRFKKVPTTSKEAVHLLREALTND